MNEKTSQNMKLQQILLAHWGKIFAMAIIFLLALGIFYLSGHQMMTLSFYAYYIIAVLVGLFLIYGGTIHLHKLKLDSVDNTLTSIQFRLRIQKPLYATLTYMGTILIAIAFSVIWPIALLTFLIMMRRMFKEYKNKISMQYLRQQQGAYFGLNPVSIIMSWLVLGIMIMLFIGTQTVIPNHVHFWLYLPFIIHFIAILFAMSLSPEPLAVQCRKGTRNPYFSLFLIVIPISASLIILVLQLEAFRGIEKIDISNLIDTVGNVFLNTTTIVWNSIQGNASSWTDYVIVLVSVGFFLSVIRALRYLPSFRRSSNDFHTLAHGNIVLGKYDVALQWLSYINDPSRITNQLRAAALFGMEQQDNALIQAKQIASGYNYSNGANPNEFFVISLLIFPQYNFSFDTYLTFLKNWIIRGASDSEFAYATMQLIFKVKFSGRDFKVENFRNAFIQNTTGMNLTNSFLYSSSGELDLAISTAENAEETTEFGKAVKTTLLLYYRVISFWSGESEDQSVIQTTILEFEKIIKPIEKNYLYALAIISLCLVIQEIMQRFSPKLAEKFEEVYQTLPEKMEKGMPESNPLIRVLKEMVHKQITDLDNKQA
jgi:hypothetical protein